MIELTSINLPPIYHFSSSVILLLAVIILKSIIGLFIKTSPLSFFNFYCLKLAEKVNKSNNPKNQQTIAGFVAMVITLAPLAIILWLFEMFVEVDWLWHAFLLYLSLGDFTLKRESKTIAQALVANKSYLAKATLQPYLLRETNALSTLGLSKACIEMQLLRTLQQTVAVSFYFIILGPLFAICYRLLLEMHYNWNVKQQNFLYFGQYPSQIINLLQWLPVRLFTIIMLFLHSQNGLLLTWRLIRNKFFRLNNDIALHCLALNLQIKLGGVAMVKGIKLKKLSFNDQARQPEPTDIIHTSKQLSQILFTIAIMLLMIAVVTFFIEVSIYK